ncbi:DEAD/DEAH box helicase family protein [Bradyrhizobium elkanii]|uniref:DEAD/DEAH box helicase family protein n=1 Tax=Bradyrhizobium elkanii TaxID=29448 RepID=UPI001AE95D99|nr:DEAD/DEAH box helicase family protein [Bradyrhizobium elkanii]MBP2428853.1 hypothetical protein [Bradyrhizobium elkanii]WLA93598.1 DEAD/DEAH box helicase family protein [Bradyrhizobium elkanii]
MPDPKPFQDAAIAAACASVQASNGSRRFLIADEVGLGKTVVARQVIKRLTEASRSTPLIVYYITNGQRVAHQNRDRLVDFLSDEDQKKALSKADRLNVIPLFELPKTDVVLYALTPGTSFPGQTTRLHAGRKEERAFLTALLGRAFPHLIRRLPEDAMRRNVTSDWDGLVRRYRGPVAALPRRFIRAFRAALAEQFGIPIKTQLPAAYDKKRPSRFVGQLRRALAHTVLIDRPPDLVILDEFQRYRDIISKKNCGDRLVRALFEPGPARRPAVLLLSATPYKLFATRLEENRGTEANREFFDLIEFLGGSQGIRLKQDAETAFARFGASLLAIAKNHNDPIETARLVAEASDVRDSIQKMLAKYLSRMEREPLSDHAAQTLALDAALDPADIRAFRHLASSFRPKHAWFALPFWLSVPLPAQTLGLRYMAWRDADMRRDAALVKLTEDARDRYRLPAKWPSPKLRALEPIIPPETLSLPWVPPSIPWWPLRGPWADIASDPKLLLFSRFKATPQSVAALTSLRVEAAYLARQGYERPWKTRRLQAGPSRLPTVALFHPSPFLVSATNPLFTQGVHAAPVRERVRAQLKGALKRLGIEIKGGPGKRSARRKPLWSLLAALDRAAGFSRLTNTGWTAAAGEDGVLLELVKQWHEAPKIEWISRREFDDLVTAAIASPGTIVGRALLRHFKDALSPDHYTGTVRLAWTGLRLYLDNPVFWARLPKGKPVRVLQRACIDGNLEAVLDEHFWMRRQSLPTRERGLAADLLEALSVTKGAFSFHGVNKERSPRIRVRCHVAVPFGSTDREDRHTATTATTATATEEQAPRSDELRNAFNSPFWPHVLATTSVGQEGLDFHTWCSRIVHWDLCPSPLELEQREGRIQRFGGLAVRRRLGILGETALAAQGAQESHGSLWNEVEGLANERYRDTSGLSPWWVLKGAAVNRYVFKLQQSRDIEKFNLLKEQRLIYRLALGQPNQEDLVEFLAKGGPALADKLRPLALDLSAFSRTQAASTGE